MFENLPKIPGIVEGNYLAIIAYSLMLIVGLLIYIAFVKDQPKASKSR